MVGRGGLSGVLGDPEGARVSPSGSTKGSPEGSSVDPPREPPKDTLEIIHDGILERIPVILGVADTLAVVPRNPLDIFLFFISKK